MATTDSFTSLFIITSQRGRGRSFSLALAKRKGAWTSHPSMAIRGEPRGPTESRRPALGRRRRRSKRRIVIGRSWRGSESEFRRAAAAAATAPGGSLMGNIEPMLGAWQPFPTGEGPGLKTLMTKPTSQNLWMHLFLKEHILPYQKCDHPWHHLPHSWHWSQGLGAESWKLANVCRRRDKDGKSQRVCADLGNRISNYTAQTQRRTLGSGRWERWWGKGGRNEIGSIKNCVCKVQRTQTEPRHCLWICTSEFMLQSFNDQMITKLYYIAD